LQCFVAEAWLIETEPEAAQRAEESKHVTAEEALTGGGRRRWRTKRLTWRAERLRLRGWWSLSGGCCRRKSV
jgi:hypothetical protein